ncbi:MAG: twin-arginine translocase subunit TatC, partial [Myxococcota bacterium]
MTTDNIQQEGYDDPPMTLWEHLGELRRRVGFILIALVVSAGVSWEFREQLLHFMTVPFVLAWKAQPQLTTEPTLHFETPAAAFMAYFKLSLMGGVVIAAPIIFYQIWSFIAPGLYAREKKFVIPFVFFSTALFIGGGFFGWKFAFPLAFEYLLGLSGDVATGGLTVNPTVMMGDYIGFVTRMLLAFGAIFE